MGRSKCPDGAESKVVACAPYALGLTGDSINVHESPILTRITTQGIWGYYLWVVESDTVIASCSATQHHCFVYISLEVQTNI